MSKAKERKQEQPHIVEPHVKDEQRQIEKRKGREGKPGKVEHKGGAGTSHKEKGGKMAR